jgi:AraC-like DNA-binding protein
MPTDAILRLTEIETRNPDEARALLEPLDVRLDVAARDARRFDMRFKAFSLPNGSIGYGHMATAVSILATEANSDFCAVLPVRGHFAAISGRVAADCGPGRAFATLPARGTLERSQEGRSHLPLRLSSVALTRQLAALLGEPINGRLELATELDVADGYGRSLAGYLYQTVGDFESGTSMLCGAATASSFEQFIMTALLLWLPHNYSDALRRLEKPIAPRDVKRAIDYIEAHLDSVVTLADIVAASQVPGRTLFKHFKDYRGASPMRYLRIARLKKVREALQRAEPERDIAQVAMRWQFDHMGRFAVEYRKRFGESPSETLRRRVRRSK